jgi:hypothetical protein
MGRYDTRIGGRNALGLLISTLALLLGTLVSIPCLADGQNKLEAIFCQLLIPLFQSPKRGNRLVQGPRFAGRIDVAVVLVSRVDWGGLVLSIMLNALLRLLAVSLPTLPSRVRTMFPRSVGLRLHTCLGWV